MIATSMGENKLTAIDIKTEKPDFEILLPGIPRPLTFDPKDHHIFVQLSKLHGFAVVDYNTRKVTGNILLPDAPPGAKPLIPRHVLPRPRRRARWQDAVGDKPAGQFGTGVFHVRSETPGNHPCGPWSGLANVYAGQ